MSKRKLPPSERGRTEMTTEQRLAYIGNMLTCVGKTRDQIHETWESCLSGRANPGLSEAVKDGQVEMLMDMNAAFYLVIGNDHIIGDSQKWRDAINAGVDAALSGNRIRIKPYKGRFAYGEGGKP